MIQDLACIRRVNGLFARVGYCLAMTEPYPGELATPSDLLRLADEYRRAAEALRGLGRHGAEVSLSPFRFVSIHAIELYLNALLLANGMKATEIRGYHHDLARRAERARSYGIVFRLKTFEHLKKLSEERAYIAVRYEPCMTSSQINRMTATLGEVATKVRTLLGRPPVPTPEPAPARVA